MNYSNNGDVINVSEFNKEILHKYVDGIKLSKSNKKIEYYNIPCAFDIETSSFYEYSKRGLPLKRACMYEWTLGINGLVVIGRNWLEFESTIDFLVEELQLSLDRQLVIYVHNLAYEFQFIRKRFEWSNVFCSEERKPFYAITHNGVCFKCSYLLSGYSLAKIGENLQKYPLSKMVGDLDYSLIRHSQTPLTDKELGYCINDVRVVMSYIQEKIESDGSIADIVLTKTGYVRKYCRKRCFYGDKTRRKNDYQYLKYNRFIHRLTIDPDEYLMLKRAFMGGFTHASCFKSGKVYENVHSYDFTSSYPAVMLSEKYPMSKGEEIRIKNKEEFEHNLKYYLCVFEIEFTELESTFGYEHYISFSKCRNCENIIEENGRVAYASHCTMTITNVDFEIIKQTYTWEYIKIGRFIRYMKGYLPKAMIEAVLTLYEKKTTLKGVEEKEEEYLNSKEMLNSCYGMMVTDILRDEIIYSKNEWSKEKPLLDEVLQHYNDSKQRFTTYAWGIFIPAYARRNLWYGITELKNDYIYSDTDSLKFTNLKDHKKFFDDYNKMILKKCEKMMNYYNLPVEKLQPKTIKGTTKIIGEFDYEGMYDKFKTLGAKRYMTFKDDKLSITISGVNKINALPFLLKKYKTIDKCFEAFNDDLLIPADYTGKQIHAYIDDEIYGTVTDYFGNVGEYDELSCIHLEKAEYSLSLSENYIRYLEGLEDE